jgi:hypothetical protein
MRSKNSKRKPSSTKQTKRKLPERSPVDLVAERVKLAAAISEILSNPLTPTRLYNEVGNFITDVSNKMNDDSPEIIEKILAFGECGFILCPGTTDGSVCPGPDAHPKDSEKD